MGFPVVLKKEHVEIPAVRNTILNTITLMKTITITLLPDWVTFIFPLGEIVTALELGNQICLFLFSHFAFNLLKIFRKVQTFLPSGKIIEIRPRDSVS